MYEGRVPIIGNRIQYRIWGWNETATTSEFRMRVSGSGGDLVGPTHVLGAGLNSVFEDVVNVAVERGGTYDIRWEARRTSGANRVRAALIFVRCYTP
jgi:hypothetical protein